MIKNQVAKTLTLFFPILYTANIYRQFTAVLLSKGGTVPPMTVHCQWRYDYRHFLVTIQLMTVGITLSSCN